MFPSPTSPVALIQSDSRRAVSVLAWGVSALLLLGVGVASAQEEISTQPSLEQQARSAQRAGDYEQADALWFQAIEEAQTSEDAACVACFARELLSCRMQLENYDGALIAAQLAAAAHEHLEEPELAAQVYTYLASLLRAAGEYTRAASATRSALEILVKYDDIPGQAAAHMSLAILADLQGLLPKAASEFSEARELFRELGDSANVALCYCNQGYAYERLGMTSRALAAYEQAEYLYAGMKDTPARTRMLIACGRMLARQGDYEVAQQRFETALTLMGPDGAAGMRAKALVGSGSALMELDEFDAARAQLEAAWAIYEELEDYTTMETLIEVLAKVADSLGDDEAAKRYREWQAPDSD